MHVPPTVPEGISMNTVTPQHDRQAPTGAVTWWRRFHGALRMLCLLAVGVLALGVAANAAPAKRQIGRPSGPAPIALEQIVTAGNTIYGLAASHQGVYEWSGVGGHWNQVFGPAKKIHSGGGTLYATDQAGNPWKFDPQLGHAARYGAWTQIGGPGLDFVATDQSFFGLGPDRKVHQYQGKPGQWQTVRSQATAQIYGGHTLLATASATGNVSKYDGKAEKWTQIGGPGLQFASTDRNIFGLGPDRKVHRYQGKPGQWQTVRSQATGQIYGGGTLFATDTSAGHATGDVSKYDGKAEKWTKIGGPGATFTTNGDRIYGLSPDRKAVFQYTGKPGNWTSLGAPLGTPADKLETLQRLHELTQPGDAARNAWNKARNSHQRNHWDRFGFIWDKDFCSSPGKDRIGTVDFRIACARHDFGYRNYKRLLGLEQTDLTRTPEGRAAKHRVDQTFLKDLQKACDTGNYKPGCYTVADLYHQSVVHAGTKEQKERFPGW
ncbi:phospholipase A2 (plasmid) [Streptomyces xanthophaeus]|uniref:phospholipase A2 n=1 Tax=Streptomyces xanthophaeus TaxID=67385 RepID=UPI00398FA11D